MNDREWVQAALRRHEAPLILYAAKICGSTDRARDAVQDTFLELCAADRRALEPHLAQWLFTVCRNKALDLRRKMSSGTLHHIVETSLPCNRRKQIHQH